MEYHIMIKLYFKWAKPKVVLHIVYIRVGEHITVKIKAMEEHIKLEVKMISRGMHIGVWLKFIKLDSLMGILVILARMVVIIVRNFEELQNSLFRAKRILLVIENHCTLNLFMLKLKFKFLY